MSGAPRFPLVHELDSASMSISLDRLLNTRIDSRSSRLDGPVQPSQTPMPFNEVQRLSTLRGFSVLDTAAEQAYDDLASIAAAVCRTPIALISLIDRDRQWFKARHGVDLRQTSRDQSFCAHAILRPDEVMEVHDALHDPRFRNFSMVREEPGVRFYAGAPLVSPDGMALGAIAVLDRRPRVLLAAERNALESLARQVVAQLQLRQAAADQRLHTMTDGLTGAWNRLAFDRRLREEWSRHSRSGNPLALLMLDLDHFEQHATQYGPQATDGALQAAVQLAERTLRNSDFLARYAGHRLAVLLPESDAAGAQAAAEKLRLAFADAPWRSGKLTLSIGAAGALPAAAADPHALLARCDRALFEAIQQGRNCVVSFHGWD